MLKWGIIYIEIGDLYAIVVVRCGLWRYAGVYVMVSDSNGSFGCIIGGF